MEENSVKKEACIEKKLKEDAMAVFRQIVSEILETPEFKKIKNDAVINALSFWAGRSSLKKMIVGQMTKKMAAEARNAGLAPKTNIENLKIWGNIGKMITLGSAYIAEKDKADPGRMANILEKPVKDLLANTDFGNIYEMVAASETRAIATQRMIQDVIGEFPTKAGILPAIKLNKINTSLKKKNLMLTGMEDIPPEMLINSLLNLLDSLIESNEIGLLIANISEVLRKLHTGSAILSEAGKSLVETVLSKKIRSAFKEVDPTIFNKAVTAIVEECEAISNSFMAPLSENPDIIGNLLASYGARKNSKIRKNSKKADMLETFIDQEKRADFVKKGVADLDTQMVGETINTWLRILNTLHEYHPEIARTPISSLFSIVDQDELKSTVKWLIPEVFESVKPVAGVVMPYLLNELSESLSVNPGEDIDELEKALSKLRNILLNNGGQER